MRAGEAESSHADVWCGVSIAPLPRAQATPKYPPLSTTPDLIGAVEVPLPFGPPCLPLVPQNSHRSKSTDNKQCAFECAPLTRPNSSSPSLAISPPLLLVDFTNCTRCLTPPSSLSHHAKLYHKLGRSSFFTINQVASANHQPPRQSPNKQPPKHHLDHTVSHGFLLLSSLLVLPAPLFTSCGRPSCTDDA